MGLQLTRDLKKKRGNVTVTQMALVWMPVRNNQSQSIQTFLVSNPALA